MWKRKEKVSITLFQYTSIWIRLKNHLANANVKTFQQHLRRFFSLSRKLRVSINSFHLRYQLESLTPYLHGLLKRPRPFKAHLILSWWAELVSGEELRRRPRLKDSALGGSRASRRCKSQPPHRTRDLFAKVWPRPSPPLPQPLPPHQLLPGD